MILQPCFGQCRDVAFALFFTTHGKEFISNRTEPFVSATAACDHNIRSIQIWKREKPQDSLNFYRNHLRACISFFTYARQKNHKIQSDKQHLLDFCNAGSFTCLLHHGMDFASHAVKVSGKKITGGSREFDGPLGTACILRPALLPLASHGFPTLPLCRDGRIIF